MTQTKDIVGYDASKNANEVKAFCMDCAHLTSSNCPIYRGEAWGGSVCNCEECGAAIDVELVPRRGG